MVKHWTLLFVLLGLFGLAQAQDSVYIGGQWRPVGGSPGAFLKPTRGSYQPAQLLLTLRCPLNAAQRRALAEQGIVELAYYSGRTYRAIDSTKAASARVLPGVEAVCVVQPSWKLTQRLVRYVENAPNSRVEVRLFTLGVVPRSTVEQLVSSLDGTLQCYQGKGSNIVVALPAAALVHLAAPAWVALLDLPPVAPSLENRESARLMELPSDRILGAGLQLEGQGVRVGIWDGNVWPHTDFGQRLHTEQWENTRQASLRHGTHVAGTIAGAGVLEPLAKGIAPAVDLYAYNYSMVSVAQDALTMQQAHRDKQVSISSNSYGVNLSEYCKYWKDISYNAFGRETDIDRLAYENPNFLLVFSVGNDRGACSAHPQWTTTTKRNKNALLVGASTHLDVSTSFSSTGPMDDGRLAPHVLALGEQVYSSAPHNAYATITGTSQACPAVSGLAALLTQQYKLTHGDQLPPAALLRAIIMNTATDVEQPGPDYTSGFGTVNAQAASRALDREWFAEGHVAQDEEKSTTIQVPSGASSLRVMLVWDDPASTPRQYAYKESPMVNDLDLSVEGVRPFILDPANPAKPAIRDVDDRNNVEQVLLSVEGKISVQALIRGTRIAEGSPQRYHLVWYFEQETAPRFLVPAGGELYAPRTSMVIRWESNPAGGQIAWSGDGKQWVVMGRADGQNVLVIPKLSPDMAAHAACRLRLVTPDGRVVESQPFTVLARPQLTFHDAPPEGTPMLQWKKVDQASGYQLSYLQDDDQWSKPVDLPADATSFSLTGLNAAPTHTFYRLAAVSAVSGKAGLPSVAIPASKHHAITILPDQLPWVDSFPTFPDRYLYVEQGENMRIQANSSFAGRALSPKANVLLVAPLNAYEQKPLEPRADWPWAQARNRVTATTQVDLRQIQGLQEGLWLQVSLRQTYDTTPADSQFRLLLDGQPLREATGLQGIAEQSFTIELENGYNPVRTFNYDISAYQGKQVVLQFQFAGKTAADVAEWLCYGFYTPGSTRRVALENFDVPQLQQERSIPQALSVTVRNTGSAPLQGLLVGYRDLANESSWTIEEIGQTILPGQTVTHRFQKAFDFSTSDPLGHTFSLEAAVMNCPDDTPNDNALQRSATVYKQGIYLMPRSTYTELLGGQYNDPNAEVLVEGQLIFLPQNGPYRPYAENQRATVTFKPRHAGTHFIRATFQMLDLQKGEGFTVYHEPTWSSPLIVMESAPLPTPVSSTMADGSLMFNFKSSWRPTSQKGWRILVEELPYPPVAAIVAVKAGTPDPGGKVPVSIVVANPHAAPLSKVPLQLLQNDNTLLWSGETADLMPGQERTIEAGSYDFSPQKPGYVLLRGWGVTQVPDFSLNSKTLELHVDDYCDAHHVTYQDPQGQVTDGDLLIKRMAGKSISSATKQPQQGINYRYTRKSPIVAYLEDDPRVVRLNEELSPVPAAGAYLHVAVDWNENNVFDDDEISSQHYDASAPVAPIVVPNKGLADKVYRLRAVYTISQEQRFCGDIPGSDIVDLSVKVAHQQRDLGLTAILTGDMVLPAVSAPVKLAFTVSNLGTMPLASCDFAAQFEGKSEEKWTHVFSPQLQPGQSCTVEHELPSRPDVEGIYSLTVRVMTPDTKSSNDELRKTIHCWAAHPATGDRNSYLTLQRYDRSDPNSKPERIDLGNLKELNISGSSGAQKAVAFEGWFRFDDSKTSNMFRGKGVTIGYTGDQMASFPQHALLVKLENSSKQYTTFCTEANSLTPYKWHHVLVMFYYGSMAREENRAIYIDGQRMPNVREGRAVPFNTGNLPLYVGDGLQGAVKRAAVFTGIKPLQLATLPIEWNGQANHDFLPLPGIWLGEELLGTCQGDFDFNAGPGASYVQGGDGLFAQIISPRDLTVPGQLWQQYQQLVDNVHLEGATTAYRPDASGAIVLELPSGHTGKDLRIVVETDCLTPLDIYSANAPTKLLASTANGRATLEGIDLSSSPYSFSIESKEMLNPALPEGTFKLMRKTYTLSWSGQVQPEANILAFSLPKADNPTLAHDVEAEVKEGIVTLSVPANADLRACVAQFTVSPGAQVSLAGVPLQPGITTLDLQYDRLLTVVSAHGETIKPYRLHIVMEKPELKLSSLDPIEMVYGQTKPLPAVLVPTEGIAYEVVPQGVAQVVRGELLATGVGEAKVVCTLPAKGPQPASDPVEVKLVVSKAAVTLTPKNLKFPFCAPSIQRLPMDWAPLVWPADSSQFAQLDYKLYNSAGAQVSYAPDRPLPVGKYTWKPQTPTLATMSYNATLGVAQVEVTGENAFTLPIKIVDPKGEPVTGVSLTLRSGEGALALELTDPVTVQVPKTTLAYTATKEGYGVASGTFDLKGVTTYTLEIVLRPKQYMLTCAQTIPGGRVVGQLEQKLAVGEMSTPWLAVPVEGYTFKRWRTVPDGTEYSKENPLQPRELSGDLQLEPIFAPAEVVVKIASNAPDAQIDYAGSPLALPAELKLPYGSALQLTVRPLTASGQLFTMWHDGASSASYTIDRLCAPVQLQAYFSPEIPNEFSDDLAENALKPAWLNVDANGSGKVFVVATKRLSGHTDDPVAYLVADAQNNTSTSSHDVYLVSPWIASKKGAVFEVSTDYYLYRYTTRADFFVEYRFAWQTGDKVDYSPWQKSSWPITSNPYALAAPQESLGGKLVPTAHEGSPLLQVRYRYRAGLEGVLVLDNFRFRADLPPEPLKAKLVLYIEPADALKVLTQGQLLADGAALPAGSALAFKVTEGYDLLTLTVNGQPHDANVAYVVNPTTPGEAVTVQATLQRKAQPKPLPVESAGLAHVALYPNPVAGHVELMGVDDVVKVELLSLQGRQLRAWRLGGQTRYTLHVGELPAGVYLLKLQDAGGRTQTLRIVKQ